MSIREATDSIRGRFEVDSDDKFSVKSRNSLRVLSLSAPSEPKPLKTGFFDHINSFQKTIGIYLSGRVLLRLYPSVISHYCCSLICVLRQMYFLFGVCKKLERPIRLLISTIPREFHSIYRLQSMLSFHDQFKLPSRCFTACSFDGCPCVFCSTYRFLIVARPLPL